MTSQKRRFARPEHEAGHEHSAAELDAMRRALDERLDHLLATEGAATGGRDDRLAGAMRAAVLGSGKRMRPLLLMLVAADLRCSSPAVTDVACAVEIVHAASLILDDMPCMDDAALRRGQPTIHRQFGEDVAILASVALLSRAFGILSTAPGIPPVTRARLVATLAETVGAQGLVRGQYEDLHGGAGRSAEAIATTNERKTGLLLGAAVDMAAVLAEVDDCVASALRAFALAAGHAFQIRDDFQDLPGNDSAVTGKDTGLDLGKATLVNTYGIDEAQRRLAGHLHDVERHLGEALAGAQRTRQFVRRMFAAHAAVPRQAPAAVSSAVPSVVPSAGSPAVPSAVSSVVPAAVPGSVPHRYANGATLAGADSRAG